MFADLSLIRDYTLGDDRTERPVVITRFKKAPNTLYYVNAQHVSGIDNATCAAVRDAIETCKPHLVIVEGVPTECGRSPPFYVDAVKRDAANKGFGSEVDYAAWLAHRNQIPFIGGEPTNAQICADVDPAEYSTRDIMAFSVLRKVPQDRRDGHPMDASHFAERASQYLDRSFQHVPAGERLTPQEVEAWYAAHRTDGKPFLEITSMDTAPFPAPAADFFQQLSRRIDSVRERHLDRLIAASLETDRTVLVVYGDAHLVKSRAVFEKMLGPGTCFEARGTDPTKAYRPLRAKGLSEALSDTALKP